MKKVLMFLCLIMLLFSATKVNAIYYYSDEPQLTIKNAHCDTFQKYKFYRMMDVDDDSFYSSIGPGWGTFFRSGYGANLVTFDADGKVMEFKDNIDAKEFAKKAYEFAIKDELPPTETSESDTCSLDNTIVHKFTMPGYYLVVSPMGEIPAVVNVNPTAEMNEKNIFTPEAEIFINDKGVLKKYADAVPGENIEYVIKINLIPGMSEFYLEIIYGANTHAISGNTFTVEGINSSNYQILSDTSFRIEKSFLDSLEDATTITLKVKTNYFKSAATSSIYNSDTTFISYYYAQDGHGEDKAILYNWSYKIKDVYLIEGSDARFPLDRVHYILSRNNSVSNPDPVEFVLSGGEYRVATYDDLYQGSNLTTDLVTGSYDGLYEGAIQLIGLDSGTYYLIQTAVPEGFSKNLEPIEIKIETTEDADGLHLNNNEIEIVHSVVNVNLPETGGMGTTLLISIGLLLFLSSLVIIICKVHFKNFQ